MSYLVRRRWQCLACGGTTMTPPSARVVVCMCQQPHLLSASMTEITGPADWMPGIGLQVVRDNGAVI